MSPANVLLVCWCLCAAWAGGADGTGGRSFQVAFEWKFVNFTWSSPEQIEKFNYHPEDYIPVGIRVHDRSDRIFIALPRNKPNARITLATIPINSTTTSPLFTPYPDWDMNFGESCDTLQNVQAVDIDLNDVMWVLDGTRNNNFTRCPAKIVLLDMKRGGEVLQTFVVPDELCSVDDGCFLNDLIVDGDRAYCSDFTTADPGIFVYDRTQNRAWKIRNDRTMQGDPKASNFTAQGVKFTSVSPINGIALSPNCARNRTFYYTPQTSFHIYGIPTEVIGDSDYSNRDVDRYIETVATKPAATGGMIGDARGNVYFGLLPLDAVAVKYPNASAIEILDRNSTTITWPDSFAFDLKGNLYMTATSILKFHQVGIDISENNFRVLKLPTETRSYQYCD